MSDEEINTKEDLNKALFVSDFVYTKVFELPVPGTNRTVPAEFGFREISGYESDKLANKAINLNARTGKTEMLQEEANVKYIKACLVKAPFIITEENIRKLSRKVKDALLDFAQSINSLPTSENGEDDAEKK